MSTTFEKLGSAVLVNVDGTVFSVPATAFIYPSPRQANTIFISNKLEPYNEIEGLPINIDTIEGITFSDRNELITELTNRFFFNQLVTTPEGGIVVRMVNNTNAPSVKGTVVKAGSVNNSFAVNEANIPSPIGVVYENGINHGEHVYVVISGIAEVLLENGTSSTAGYWAKVSDTVSGRADMRFQAPPSNSTIAAIDDHFSEIGHCIETKAAGTNVLAKCILHFN